VTVLITTESLPISAEGYARRCDELAALRTDGRRELRERLREARRDGDVADNPALQDLLEEQVQLERRIALLEASLAVAEVVEPVADGRADIGSFVTVRDGQGATFEYQLVGPLEFDMSKGRISSAAPVGQALLGKRAGETVDVTTPRGPLALAIVAVSPPPTVARTGRRAIGGAVSGRFEPHMGLGADGTPRPPSRS
jgi:transcription elongation factor GreA